MRQQYDKRTTGVGQLAVGKKNLEKKRTEVAKAIGAYERLKQGIDLIDKAKGYFDKYDAKLKEYRQTLRVDDPTYEDLKKRVYIPLKAVNDAAQGLKAMGNYLKEKNEAQKGKAYIFEFLSDARQGAGADWKMSAEAQKELFAQQEAVLRNDRFLNRLSGGLEVFEVVYNKVKLGEQIVDRAHGVLQEWEKIDENEFLNRD